MSIITINGTSLSEYHIVCGDDASEKYAASELKVYFEKITGEEFKNCGSKTIRFTIDESSGICSDGFKIINTEDELSIVGGGKRGVIYGAYEILEKYFGVRFFTPTLEKLGDGGDIPLCEYTVEPIFKDLRDSDWIFGYDPKWRVKQHINGTWCQIPDEMGGTYRRANGGCHTVGAIFGIPQTEEACLSDPKNLEIAIKYVRDILKNNPNPGVINVSQNDNNNPCKCEKCAAVAAEEGSYMGPYIRFINAIADDIKEDYPNQIIETLAYVYTRKPSKTKPRDNVQIRLCSIECCFSHELSDKTCEKNKYFVEDTEGWAKICDRITVWHYVTNFKHYIGSYPNFGVIREHMNFYANNHVTGMYPQGNYQGKSGEFGELRAYLLAKLMWNPLMSEIEYYAHMDEFLEAYYGAGWRYIRAYIDFTTTQARNHHMGFKAHPRDILTPDMVRTMASTIENWWNAAEAAAGDKIENVKRSRLQWTYLWLWGDYDEDRAKKFYNETLERDVRWREGYFAPSRPEFDKYIEEWYNTEN